MAVPEKPLRTEDFTGNGLELLGDYLARRTLALYREIVQPISPAATERIRGRLQEVGFLSALVKPKLIPRGTPGQLGVEDMDEHAERWILNASPEERAEALE